MHPHLTTVLGRLDAARTDLHAAVDSVPAPLRAQKPARDRWSVNEVVEHIGLVEERFLTMVLAEVDRALAAGLGPEIGSPPLLPDQLQVMVIDRVNKRSAPDTVQPTGTVDSMTGLQRIADAHTRLRDGLAKADGLALGTVTCDHRFFGTLNVYQWVELLAGHEERHMQQVREVATQISAA
jgi:hypothetical protein